MEIFFRYGPTTAARLPLIAAECKARKAGSKRSAWMSDPTWENISQRLDGVDQLPTLPTIVLKTTRIINNPDSDIHDLYLLLKNDPAITMKIMKLANSAYYGLSRSVESLQTALVILGMKEVGRIVNTVVLLKSFPPDLVSERFDYKRFWGHSATVAEMSQVLSRKTGVRFEGDVFTPGLLHDIGKLILAIYFPSDFIRCVTYADEFGLSLLQAERKVLGVDHARLGAELVRRWELADTFYEVVSFHHQPHKAQHHPVTCALIHLADHLCSVHGLGFGSHMEVEEFLANPAWDILEQNGADRQRVNDQSFTDELDRSIQNAKLLTELAIT